jgi:hypothetical protein
MLCVDCCCCSLYGGTQYIATRRPHIGCCCFRRRIYFVCRGVIKINAFISEEKKTQSSVTHTEQTKKK